MKGPWLTMILFAWVALQATAASASDTGDTKVDPIQQDVPPRWVVETYAKKATARSGVSVNPKDVVFEKTDLNNDGYTDWLVYSSLDCGSVGCAADVYAFIGKRYCYVGTTRYGDAPDALRNKYRDLKCEVRNTRLKEPL
jgi:hypothetical protein